MSVLFNVVTLQPLIAGNTQHVTLYPVLGGHVTYTWYVYSQSMESVDAVAMTT